MTRSDLPTLRLQHALRSSGISRTTAVGVEGASVEGTGRARRTAHAELVDDWLRTVWNGIAGLPESGVALAATGSLGRRDAGPLSDLDLVLLHDPRRLDDAAVAEIAASLWYPIWDSGTALDHAVRTPADCLRTAAEDWAAAIGLLDLRPVAGDADLVAATSARIGAAWRASSRRRIAGLVEFARGRPGAREPLAHRGEPDLKHGGGGLRDLAVLRALTATWLVSGDRPPIGAAETVLLDARDALQAVTGRRSTVLVRAEQDAVAGLCGADDADAHLAAVAEAGRTVAHALDRAVRDLGAGHRARRPFTVGEGTLRRPRLEVLDDGLVRQGDEISLARPGGADDPSVLLLAARTAARAGDRLSDATLRGAQGSPGPDTPWSPAVRDAFVDLLAAGDGFADLYEDLDLAGLMTAWVPGWDGIRNRPQRSAVHRWSVDRHLVGTVVETARSAGLVPRPDLLLLAALLHDLGKREGARDHAAEGAPLARRAALSMGWPPADAEVVTRLVAEHLTLVELATTRDPEDDATVAALLGAVDHDRDLLRMLRILTEADARAASPRAWTAWRARLVDHLVDRAEAALVAAPGRDPQVVPAALRGPLAALERGALGEVRRTGAAAVAVGESDGVEPLPLVLAAPDRVGVLAAMVAVLDAAHLPVRAALVRTEGGTAVDSFWVRPSGSAAPDPILLRAALDRELSRPLPPAPARPRADAADSSVVLVPGASSTATVLQVNAPDRPGVLADAARALARHGVALRSAHVVTRAGRAIDTLYLADIRGRQLAPADIAVLIGALIDAAAPR